MLRTIKAKFKNGEFVPITSFDDVEEGEIVQIILKKNIKNLGFVGMWRDRKDINSGVDYVKKVRLLNRFN